MRLTVMRSLICMLLLNLLVIWNIDGQQFKASAILGLNASQINGDDFAGYDKVGILGGLGIAYPLKPKVQLALELLFSQRGSQSEFTFGNPDDLQSIELNYIEIPLFVKLLDWYIEEKDYHKVHLEGGISMATLIQSKAQNSFFEDRLDEFNSFDFSLLLGAGYHFTPSLGIGLRYTRSLNNLYHDEAILERGLLGYFLTFRVEYQF